MAQIILITAGKGGVGKSTVSALLGRALAACGKTVLLLEASHRSLDVLFGVSDAVLFDLADVLGQRCGVEEAMLSVGENASMRLICAPLDEGFSPDPALCAELTAALSDAFDFVLIDLDGCKPAQLAAVAPCAGRAVIVTAADAVSARGGRAVSDALDAAGVRDLRLCINQLPQDFDKLRPVPDLDWLIDRVCAQLIAVVPFDKNLTVLPEICKSFSLLNLSKMVFDNFAQRILGNYIDLLVD